MGSRKGENSNNWKGGRIKDGDGYVRILQSSHSRADTNGYVLEHILVAEKTLGRALKPGEEIHHYGARDDNTKIVICPNHKYHMLLHQRMRAFKACGHYNWRKCRYCKQYDKPENLYINGSAVCHKKCKSQYQRERYLKLKNRRSNNEVS